MEHRLIKRLTKQIHSYRMIGENDTDLFECECLRGSTIIGGSFSVDYFESLRGSLVKGPNGEFQLGSGFGVLVYRYFQDSYHFKEGARNGSPIGITPQGQLTGLGAQLVNGEINISILASTFLDYRLKDLTYLHPTYYEFIQGVFVQPEVTAIRNVHLRAFEWSAWLSLFTVFAIIMAGIVCTNHLLPILTHQRWSWTETMFWGIATLSSRSFSFRQFPNPNVVTIKIFMLCGLLMSSVTFTAYSAILTALYSVDIVPVKSLEDLISFHFQIYYDRFSPDTRNLVEELESDGSFSVQDREVGVDDGIQKVLSGNNAFLNIYSDGLIPVIRQNHSDSDACRIFSRIVISQRPVLHGMLIHKTAHVLKECFNRKIIQMYETGFRFRYIRSYHRKHSFQCLPNMRPKKSSLSIYDVIQPFTAFVIGALISGIILIFEITSAYMIGTNQ